MYDVSCMKHSITLTPFYFVDFRGSQKDGEGVEGWVGIPRGSVSVRSAEL